ncbi:hypothetical protein M0805_001585 [Coniferiporia weirii]|nr:hypothetical protein M0805_001585 [Coniferiporia weirii]
MSETPAQKDTQTLLSYLLKTVPYDAFPSDPQPQTLHPFAPSSPDAPLTLLRDLADASTVLHSTLQAYSNLPVSDHKLVSILRQSTALIHSLHVSDQNTSRRVEALKGRYRNRVVYGDPIPLDKSMIPEWCISRIEEWGRKTGMEVFKDDERNGRMTVILGGKVLVVEVDIVIRKATPGSPGSHISVSSVKTTHALPAANSANSLAERSASLDSFILQTWNHYLAEVQSEDPESSTRAAYLARDIQSHLSYLMKLDVLALREGDQGMRWFNDIGLMSTVTEQVAKTEINSILTSSQSSTVNLDIFLSRAHALAVPYLVAPSMSFLIYLSPLAYYSILRASESDRSKLKSSGQDADAFLNLDISPSTLRSQLIRKDSRLTGIAVATLTLARAPSLPTISEGRSEHGSHLCRPYFRLPGTSPLALLDHTFTLPPQMLSSDPNSGSVQDVWMLDFTDSGKSIGIVMSHSRMREIQQVLDPGSTISSMGLGMQVPHLPGSWVGQLINPAHPPSERYIAIYKSPSDIHPPLRLRLTAPNEAGFVLEKVPVRSLKEVYGVLEIIRDQCWLNETLKTVDWIAEDLMSEVDGDDNGSDQEASGSTGEDLDALLSGNYRPRRIPVNVFLPTHDVSDGPDPDVEAVPGLGSISVSAGVTTPAPSIFLAFAVHMPKQAGQGITPRPSQAALVLRHDRTRRRGVRVNANVATSLGDGSGSLAGDSPPAKFIDELEESVRRGGAFGAAGRVWGWASGRGS